MSELLDPRFFGALPRSLQQYLWQLKVAGGCIYTTGNIITIACPSWALYEVINLFRSDIFNAAVQFDYEIQIWPDPNRESKQVLLLNCTRNLS